MHAANPARGPRPFLRLLARLAWGIAAVGAALVAPAAPKAKAPYDYYLTGNRADAASSQPPRSPGGDQSDYIEFWKGTALDDAIRDLVRRNVPIGGTSAGLSVLGQFDFAALKGSVTSADALANPYNRRMTLDRDFLTAAAMTGIITDSHFDERDRMGRLLAFLARLTNPSDGWIGVDAARAIGVDPSTAVAIEKGVATRLADRDEGVDLGGSVYFLRPSIAPTVCEPRQPLTFRNVLVERLSGAGSFHVKNWTGVGGATTRYDLSAEAGMLISSQPGGGIY